MRDLRFRPVPTENSESGEKSRVLRMSALVSPAFVMIILGHARRKIVRAAVTQHPTAAWLSRPGDRSVPVGHASPPDS